MGRFVVAPWIGIRKKRDCCFGRVANTFNIPSEHIIYKNFRKKF